MTDLIPTRLLPGAVVLAGIFLLAETWWHARAGWVAIGRGGPILRRENPAGFWMMIGMKVLVAVFALWLGLHFR